MERQTIKRGWHGDDVRELQRLLRNVAVDGVFGAVTEEVLRQFQREAGLTADGICGPKTWAALYANAQKSEQQQLADGITLTKSRRKINEIIVHCTATPEGRNLTVKDITDMHRARGFSTIGYHYVIDLNGKVLQGRDVNMVGAHCSGHNTYSIGVVYVGGCTNDGKLTPKDTRTEAQKRSLLSLLKRLRQLYPKAPVIGHRDTSPDLDGDGLVEPNEWVKACPCFDAASEYRAGKLK